MAGWDSGTIRIGKGGGDRDPRVENDAHDRYDDDGVDDKDDGDDNDDDDRRHDVTVMMMWTCRWTPTPVRALENHFATGVIGAGYFHTLAVVLEEGVHR
jgi:hypothetical protein